MKEKNNFFNSLFELTKRNMLLFLKDKSTVVFSLLAPFLIVLIYVLFLGDIMTSTANELIPSDVVIEAKSLKLVVNSWMISGVVAISCLTVSFNSLLCMIADKETKTINDFTASPVSTVKLMLSYFLASVILTFLICLLLMIIVMMFLSITSGVLFSISEILMLLLILFLSCLSAVMVMLCIMSFFKTNSAAAAFNGVFSALIGFLIGAYMPMSMLPNGVENFSNLLPGAHSAGLFRYIFMSRAINELPDAVGAEIVAQLKSAYSFDLTLFGKTLSPLFMFLYLALSVIVFFGIYLLIDQIKRKTTKD